MDQLESASGSQIMDLTSSTTSLKATNRKRLIKQAADILEDHFRRVGQNPSLTEKEALLEKIKAIPGGVDYDLTRLSRWFGSRRQRLRIKERRKEQSNKLNDSRFPSLTQAAIQHLTVLASNQLHPSPELLKTWTTLLASSGAVEQDVVNWIQYRNQRQQEQQPLQHTPTPSDAATTTPEPLSAISQSQTQSTFPPYYYKQETTSSPIMPVLQLPDEHDDARTTPEPSSPTSNNDSELNQHIIHGVRDALANSPQTLPQNAAPKTAAEFDALFSPFEQRILLLLHTLEST